MPGDTAEEGLAVLRRHKPAHQSDWVQAAMLHLMRDSSGCVMLDASVLCTTPTALTDAFEVDSSPRLSAWQPPWDDSEFEGKAASLETWALAC